MFRILSVMLMAALPARVNAEPPRPNIVILFADDLGYGDLGCFGAKGWATPNLDRMASQGVRFTSFYVAQPVCSASRCGLLTGCYPNRLGIHGALGPRDRHGLNSNETTLAEALQANGYATAAIGKWHLGHHLPFLPTRHGFDRYFGLPYSNDMWPRHPEANPGSYPALPLIENETVIDSDVTPQTQATLTRRYTDQAVKFIADHRDKPFLLYLAHSFPHVPLYRSERFQGSSAQGVYGDVVQEIDWSVGEVLKAIEAAGAEKNTLVIFTSDNGPWLSYGNHAGSAGQLREGKGTVWEGGVRVPFVARWPAVIPRGATQKEPAMTIDLLPTIVRLTGSRLPALKIDGIDIGGLLRCEPESKNDRPYFFYYGTNELQAVRAGRWKLILPHAYRTMDGQSPGKDGRPGRYRMVKAGRELYDLESDVRESSNRADQHPDVVARLMAIADEARAELGDTLTTKKGTGQREPGRVGEP